MSLSMVHGIPITLKLNSSTKIFAPVSDPKYAISVVVEHGGTGSSAAAPIAKKVIKKVLERHSLRQSINNLPGDSI